MRLRHLLALAFATGATGCGPHLKREVVGRGTAPVLVRGAEDAPTPATQTTGIQLAKGTYEIALHFDVPRAQIVDYTVTCGDQTIPGRVGETFEAYRTRRLAELRAQAERDRRNVAAVTGALVGAVAPDVHASGQASGPNGTAAVDANVSGQAVGNVAGNAVAQSAVPEPELPPSDVGAGRLNARVDLTTAADGACTIAAIAEDPTVHASYDLTLVRNLDAEAREKRIAVKQGALAIRGELTASLELAGADPLARQKRAEAEARARAEAEAERARLRAEADAEAARRRAIADAERAKRQAAIDAENARRQAERDAERARLQAKLEAEAHLKITIEQQRRDAALEARGYLIAYLAGECHADPHKRERERAELAAREEQRRIQLQLQLDAKLKAEAELRAQRDAREAKLRAEREAREARLRAEREAREAKRRAEREARDAKLRAEREAREAQLRVEAEARVALELEARRAREAEKQRRLQLALSARADLQAYLVSIGARERPPMPAPIAEVPGSAPFDGAVWVAGNWTWTGGEWIWTAGGWADTARFHASGSVGGAVISVGAAAASVNIDPPPVTDPTITVTQDVPVSTNVRDHRTTTEPQVRDHRTSSTPEVRDHRSSSTSSSSSSSSSSSPDVRDQRTTSTSTSTPKVRDHRTH